MTFSVDEAVARLYPDAQTFPPSSCDFTFSAEDDDAWEASTCFQKAQLELPAFQIYGGSCAAADQSACHKQAQPQTALPIPSADDFDQPIEVFQDFDMNKGSEAACPPSMVVASDVHYEPHSWAHVSYLQTHDDVTIEVHEGAAADCSSATTPTTDGAHFENGADDERSISPTDSDGKSPSKRHVRPWTKDEHARFLMALEKFRTNKTEKIKQNGKQSTGLGPGIADVIALIVKTRDAAQVRSHAQKHFQRLRRERKASASA